MEPLSIIKHHNKEKQNKERGRKKEIKNQRKDGMKEGKRKITKFLAVSLSKWQSPNKMRDNNILDSKCRYQGMAATSFW